MRPPKALNLQAIDFLGTGPTFWSSQHADGPLWAPISHATFARRPLDVPDAVERRLQRLNHHPMHRGRFMTLDEERLVSVTKEEVLHFLVGHPAKHCWVSDLVAIEMQDG